MAHEGSRQARDRGVTRSKAEKTRPPTQPVPQVDIVPGRLNEAEWMALTALEEGEDVVGDILADLLARVMDNTFQVYLTKQCVPFTVNLAQEAILQVTQLCFLARDEGEAAVAEDPTWGEDEEPVACPTDAWAQGSVSMLYTPPAPILEEPLGEDRGNEDQPRLGTSLLTRGSLEPGASPGVPPAAGTSGESVPQDAPGGPESHDLAAFLEETLQLGVEVAPADSPEVASPQASAKDAPVSKDLSLEDLYYAAGDLPQRKPRGLPRAAAPSVRSAALRSRGSALSSNAAFRGQQPASRDAPQSRSIAIARLDPKRLPRHWVRPLVEVLAGDPAAGPLETYRRVEAPLVEEKIQAMELRALAGAEKQVRAVGEIQALDLLALHSHAHPKLRASTAGFHPPETCVPFPAFTSDPTLDLGLSSLRSKSPFLNPGLRSLAKRSKPPKFKRSPSPSPKLWPQAEWPSGCEREAELLGELWAGRTGVFPQGVEAAEKEDSEDSGWQPQMVPRFLEATSQVQWKPIVSLEAMKLAPGVSMWHPDTQELLTSTDTQEAQAGGTSQAQEQLPVQRDVSKPRVTVAHVLKKETPKA